MSIWPFRRALPVDQTPGILKRQLENGMTVFPMGEGRVSREAISEIAKQLGVTFPLELQAHWLGQFPGACVWVNEDVWPRPAAMQVGPFWTFLYGLFTYTPLSSSEEWMRLDVQGALFQQQTGLTAVPVLKLFGDANLYCIDQAGCIQEYDHELNVLKPIGTSFWSLFERELAELVERKRRYQAEGIAAKNIL